MIFWNTILLALSAIWRNKVRSLLTTLGIVIGVASVIAMVHLGQAATASVTEEISGLGSGMMMVTPGTRQHGPSVTQVAARSFKIEDAEAIRLDVSGIVVAPSVTTRSTLVFGNANLASNVTGTTNDFFTIRDWGLASGRVFEPRELTAGASVCIIGQTISETVIRRDDPIGLSLRLGRSSCQVVGVLEEKGASFGQDQDEIVLVPLKMAQRRLMGSDDVSMIYISVIDSDDRVAIKDNIEAVIRERRHLREGEDSDFHVRDMAEIASALSAATSTLTALLGAIAAVSLLVGGIGIMNIMLVSVTERTREIGIRLAIGARGREVLMQFLVESIVLAMIGGAIGAVLGLVGTWVATTQMDMPFVLSPEIIALAFLFSTAIGVVFGYVPARKAARLNPIDALRHE